MKKLQGVVPAIATPLRDDDRVDEGALRRLVRYLVGAGVDGILANGTMGGFAFLTDEEQLRTIAVVVDEVACGIPVIGGVAETGTRRAARKAKDVARLNVASIAVLAPFYYFASQENLRGFYTDVAAAVEVPMFVYDNPVLTKNHIRAETVARLKRDVPHIVGIKESTDDCLVLQDLLRMTRGDDFSVLTGSEALVVVGLQMGCDGFVGGLHNVCPHLAVALYRAFLEGRIERARDLQQDLNGVAGLCQYGNLWGAFDHALRELGIAERATGAPYISSIKEEEAAEVTRILEKYVRPYLTPGMAQRDAGTRSGA